MTRSLALALGLIAFSGCAIADGRTRIHGHVYREVNGEKVPVERADVAVQVSHGGRVQQQLDTRQDGAYEGTCSYGGMMLLLVIPLPGTTHRDDCFIQVSAAGQKTPSFAIEGKRLPDGVSRTPCRGESRCYDLEIVLPAE